MWSLAVALTLLAPVSGAVERPFNYARGDPFLAGRHRGLDLASPPGAPVRAACSGTVAVARARVVTLRCGPWRVTELPVISPAVHAGQRVNAGARLGELGTLPGHAGLHLGVRRAGDRFAYIDPLPLLRDLHHPPPVPPIPRTGPRSTAPPAPPATAASPIGPRSAARPAALAAVAPPPVSGRASGAAGGHGAASEAARALAPWPAWVGLGVVLLGAVGGGVRIRVRRNGAAVAASLPSAR